MKNIVENARRLLLGSLAIITLMFLLASAGLAQIEQAGVVYGDYKVQQSVEVGERYTSVSGNEAIYNTMENLHTGPRLLDQNLYMRSLRHTGDAIVDEMYLNSFGVGGDPNTGARLRMNKNRWYDLKADFRTDKNWWDYNTLDQPYNTPGWPKTWTNDSLHAAYQRHTMGGFDATIAPQSRVSLRLGYSRNSTSGPLYSTLHQLNDFQIMQDGTVKTNEFRVGTDVRLAPRTFVRYDQTLTRDKDDLRWLSSNVATYNVNTAASGATAVLGTGAFDPGLYYDPNYGYPCAGVLPDPSNPVFQAAKCNSTRSALVGSYYRQQPTHTSIPTEQLSFTSSYWERLDVTASGSYSDAHSTDYNYNDLATAYYAVTNVKATQTNGPVDVHQRTASADLGLTYHVSETLSVSDQMRYLHWRIPGNADLTTTTCFANANVSAPSGFISAGVGSGNGSSTCGGTATVGAAYAGSTTTPDVSADAVYRFLGERSIYNTVSASWDPSLKFGLHLGYRYGDRQLDTQSMDVTTATTYADNSAARVAGTAQTVAPLATTSQSIHEHALLFGTDLRPTSKWRVHVNYDMMYADNNFVPTAPKEQHAFKLRTTYSLDRFGKLSATLNLKDNSNDTVANYLGASDYPAGVHNPKHDDYARSYGLNYTAQPTRWVSMDMGFTYEDVYSHSGSCIPLTSGVVPEGGAYTSCVISGSSSELPAVLKYRQITNTGYFKLRWKPTRTLTFITGYDLSSGQGYQLWERADTGQAVAMPVDSTLLNVITSPTVTPYAYVPGLNPRVPLGTLNTIWQRPMAGVEYAVTRQVTFKGVYNNYQYHDKSPAGTLLLPRDFHANAGTMSVKYSF
ncbi:MAG TPA: hypothetical protein VMU24_09350 [Candidatus Acidoferrales bacterium]|nr:hypothetical protein [Candidatus Acidoferrales bacterium]